MAENGQGADPKPDGIGVPDASGSGPGVPQAPRDVEAGEAGAKALSDALKGSFKVLKVAMIALAVFYIGKGVFYVQPQEVRFKLRFGRVVSSWGQWALKSGTVHIQWPWEEVETVSTEEKALPVEERFWTRYPQGTTRERKTSLRVQEDGFLITGDANIVHMQLRARYRVRSDSQGAFSYLFGVREPTEVLRRQLLASAVKVVGSMDVMEVLKRQSLFERIEAELEARVAAFERQAGVPLGIEVVAVEATEADGTKNPTEPWAVREAFTEAQNASSLRQQLMDEGRLEAISLEEDAKARSQETLATAAGHKERLLQTAQADAEAMAKLLPIYQRSAQEAEILRETFFERTLDATIGAARSVFVLYENSDREQRFLLSAEPPSSVETDAGAH